MFPKKVVEKLATGKSDSLETNYQQNERLEADGIEDNKRDSDCSTSPDKGVSCMSACFLCLGTGFVSRGYNGAVQIIAAQKQSIYTCIATGRYDPDTVYTGT